MLNANLIVGNDGDRTSDILWRNDTGQLGLWEMSGAQILSALNLGIVGNDWSLALH
jgi:hypothetical protein